MDIVGALIWCDGLDQFSKFVLDFGNGSILSHARPMFNLGEGLLDWI